ncbi:hypothetical protein V6N13_087028 [Hibiscus sabdariffa]
MEVGTVCTWQLEVGGVSPSIVCHEGGARSIAVFDNAIGSGSVYPRIVTGGKNGDVGLHDFRYIATERTKRHRHHDGAETSVN